MTAPETTATNRVVRTDIQGLRAIAVSLVLGYHLAPEGLTGGFVGVDVFFVISGFLITLHLLERPPRTLRDLTTFWSRRIRRLLPASLLVLGVTLVASRLLAPETQWSSTARQARAAALYVVNWVLSQDAVDYLAAQNAPSPVQHFWSLAVEEQFYLVWPILILLIAGVARLLRRKPLPFVLVGLGAVVAASLTYSIQLTATNPAAAYFVTPTRIWELGIGALLATVTLIRPFRPPRWIGTPLALLGLGAIGWSAAAYTSATPFPGWQALVPVLGAAAVIAARSERGYGSPGPLLALPPVQWLGDVSYSVYLWHWPLLVIVPQYTGHSLSWTDRGSVLMATLALAGLTKTLVEDRFRKLPLTGPPVKPLVLAAAATAMIVSATSVQLTEIDHRTEDSQAAVSRELADPGLCLGAAALDRLETCPDVGYDAIIPTPIDAANDRSDAYDVQADGSDCFSYLPAFRVKDCTFGKRSSKVEVALVGNSHAGQWLPALQRVAAEQGFRITTRLASRCALADLRQRFDTDSYATACRDWVHQVTEQIVDDPPDLVVMSNRMSAPAEGKKLEDSLAEYAAGYAAVLGRFKAAGIPVLVLRDTPASGRRIPDCVARNSGDPAVCDGSRAAWLPPAPEVSVIRTLADPAIRSADLTDHVCEPTVCRAVTGGVITYFDGTHLTATYAATLAPYLGVPVRQLLLGADRR